MIIGPHRVFPGRLSVSRTIGDIEAKDIRYGGNPMCVIATPDIISFKIKSNFDYIILGCDGVFEKLNNQ
jgi:protein phosphatase 2C family protein 2/3